MSAATVPTIYAAALYEVARERGVVPRVVEDCGTLAEVFRASPELVDRVEHPATGQEQAKELVRGLFAAHAHELTVEFLQLLIDRDRFGAVAEICDELIAHADREAGVVQVRLTLAQRLGGRIRERLNGILTELLGKGVVLTTSVDPALLGGFTLRLGDRLFDASLRRRLEAMHEHLLAAPLGRMWDADSRGETA